MLSTETSNRNPTTPEQHTSRRGLFLKVGGAVVLATALMYAGYVGKWRAGLEWRLREITRDAQQLQQVVEEESAPGGNQPAKELVATLKARLAELDTQYKRDQLSEHENLAIRVAQATVANAEGRYADALVMVTEQDELRQRAAVGPQQKTELRQLLQIRGDTLYQLRQWAAALDRYQGVLRLGPKQISVQARIANCLESLGRTNEVFSAFEELAQAEDQQGNSFLAAGKLDRARAAFAKAIQVQERLLAESHSRELTNNLAFSHQGLGNTFLMEGKAASADAEYHQAIGLWRLLVEHGQRQLAGELAGTLSHAGVALIAQGKLGPALNHFDQSLELLTPMVEQPGPEALSTELALTFNSRGVVHRAQGKLREALADFDQAIQILHRANTNSTAVDLTTTNQLPEIASGLQVKLTVAVGYSETGIDLLRRIWVASEAPLKQEQTVALATCIKNRGYTHLAQGNIQAALRELNDAIAVYSPLADQEDLAVQLAKTLSSVAWLYSTYPDPAWRDGAKAKEAALKACQLSNWKVAPPLESLAAACAETGDFAQAIKWQQLALELAPAQKTRELSSRLELYKSGAPYRSTVTKGN